VFFKREWESQDQLLKAWAAEREREDPPPADAEGHRPTYATPISLAPSEAEALAEAISQAIGLKQEPPARKTLPAQRARKSRKRAPPEKRGEEIPDTWSDVTIDLRRAQLPKDSTTETGAERRMRNATVRKLIALLRPPPDKRIPKRDAQRILNFLLWEGLRIVRADDPVKALSLFLGLPGRGGREKPEETYHDIAIAVVKLVAGGMKVRRAVKQVAETRQPHLSVSRVRDIYYRHRKLAL
jgi:hypothetical protein